MKNHPIKFLFNPSHIRYNPRLFRSLNRKISSSDSVHCIHIVIDHLLIWLFDQIGHDGHHKYGDQNDDPQDQILDLEQILIGFDRLDITNRKSADIVQNAGIVVFLQIHKLSAVAPDVCFGRGAQDPLAVQQISLPVSASIQDFADLFFIDINSRGRPALSFESGPLQMSCDLEHINPFFIVYHRF